MRILCADPGEHSGYSISKGDEIEHSGICNGDDLDFMIKLIKRFKPQIVYVESQFLQSKTKGIITLIERQHNWKVAARLNNVEALNIDPAQWHGYWCLKSDVSIKSKYRRGLEFKERIVQLARFLVNDDRITKDQSDAVLINLYKLDILDILNNENG